MSFVAGAEEPAIAKARGAGRERPGAATLELAHKAQAIVIGKPADHRCLGKFAGIQHHPEVGRMPDIVEGRSQFRTDGSGIARL